MSATNIKYPLSVTDQDGKTIRLEYEDNSSRKFNYDGKGRVTSEIVYDHRGFVSNIAGCTYKYDEDGNREMISNFTGASLWTDKYGNVITNPKDKYPVKEGAVYTKDDCTYVFTQLYGKFFLYNHTDGMFYTHKSFTKEEWIKRLKRFNFLLRH